MNKTCGECRKYRVAQKFWCLAVAPEHNACPDFENKEDKTCGECKHYNDAMFHCEKFDCMAEAHNTCEDFVAKAPPTNGDKIRQLSNEDLIKFKTRAFCFYCAYHVKEGGRFTENCDKPQGNICVDGLRAWLNAPAESENNNE